MYRQTDIVHREEQRVRRLAGMCENCKFNFFITVLFVICLWKKRKLKCFLYFYTQPIVYIKTDHVDVSMDWTSRGANAGKQGCVYTDRQEEGAGHVHELRVRQGRFLVRWTAKEVLAGSVPTADAGTLTWGRRKNITHKVVGTILSTYIRFPHRIAYPRLPL